MRFLNTVSGCSLSLIMGLAPVGIADSAAQSAEVIASGLDNPRDLAFGPDGALYVVEAGTGGTSTLCLPLPTGPGERCYGATGAITRVIPTGGQQRVITGLPSLAGDDGDEATGPHGIQFGFDHAWVSIGSGGDPAALQPFAQQGIRFGWLYRISYTGQVTPVVNMAAFEAAANPDGGALDSNAYGLRVLSNRGVVADAGANALLQISATGAMSTLAVFPNRLVPAPGGGEVAMQSVPTSVVEGPDGALYVGELTGFPFPVGGARVYRVPAAGGTPTVVAEGFTNIIDLAIGSDGAAYVLEHDADGLLGPGSTGRLTRIGLFGARTELAAGQLHHPGALAIGPDNTVYVTTGSSSAGIGAVVRITQGTTTLTQW